MSTGPDQILLDRRIVIRELPLRLEARKRCLVRRFAPSNEPEGPITAAEPIRRGIRHLDARVHLHSRASVTHRETEIGILISVLTRTDGGDEGERMKGHGTLEVFGLCGWLVTSLTNTHLTRHIDGEDGVRAGTNEPSCAPCSTRNAS
jgi:hypothetical protein